MLRIELERAAVGRHRVGRPAQFAIQIAEIVVRRCGARIERKRLPVARQRRLRIAGVEQRVAEVDFAHRRNRDRAPPRRRATRSRPRGGRSAGTRHPADSCAMRRRGCAQRHAVLGGAQRHLRTAGRRARACVPAQRVVVIGLVREHRLEQRCRFRQAALLLRADRRGDHRASGSPGAGGGGVARGLAGHGAAR